MSEPESVDRALVVLMRRWLRSTGLPTKRVRRMTDAQIATSFRRIYPGGVFGFLEDLRAANA